MRLQAIDIGGYRNLVPAEVTLGPGMNFCYGANGQGKTNFLEACALLVNGRSPRTSRLQETIPWGAESAHLEGSLESHAVVYRVALTIREGSRTTLVDGISRRTVPGLAKGCVALTFLPEDLLILTGEPAARRAFLDDTVSLLEPAHAADLRAYEGALTARARLLRDFASGTRRWDPDLLAPYESILIERGAPIARRRGMVSGLFQEELRRAVDEFAIPLQIEARYQPHLGELAGTPEEHAEAWEERKARALARLIERREVDRYQRRTTLGPHRDDLVVECKGAGVRGFASRGETRLVMVLLLIAKLRVVIRRLGITPLVILDDIFSELDPARRQLVIQALPAEAQVLCSAVERDLHRGWLADRAEVRVFEVAEGRIAPCAP